ncbi:unnamed protein product [Chilo suppressalis]|uniref:Uncharacterized protein n=1 Tax=Chilo suppressalis TaxID=168631 RepID=A0ABN8B795_CHISP|nr:unnamed protein product [Chilo suppressalis]
MTWLLALGLLAVIGGVHPATTGCKNCITLGKEEKAMFRAHSDACLPQSQVDPKLVEGMLSGELTDDPRLRKHVYCVLLKCKVLDSCSDQSGDTPEDLAWNIFRCGYDKKAVLFEYMPTSIAATDVENN